MPSLKIDIIVDDKGRPVINQVSGSMRELAAATKRADAAMASHSKASGAAYGQSDLDQFEFQNPGILDGETVPVRDFLKAALQSKMWVVQGMGRA